MAIYGCSLTAWVSDSGDQTMDDSSFMVFLDEPAALSEFSNEVPNGECPRNACDRVVFNHLHRSSIDVIGLFTKITITFFDLVVSIDERLTNLFADFLRV
jgi:hypothetical protein